MDTKLLKISLLFTRISCVYFMAMWALDRITAPEHAVSVAGKYYSIGGVDFTAAPHTLIAGVLLALYAAVLVGFKKKISYLLMALVHGLGVGATLPYMLPGFESFRLIFIASFPALAAMLLLWVLRDHDTFLSVNGRFG